MLKIDKEIKISVNDNRKAAIFLGMADENLKHIKGLCEAEIWARGTDIYIKGADEELNFAHTLVLSLLQVVEDENQLNINDINYMASLLKKGERADHGDIVNGTLLTTPRGKIIKAKTYGQKRYINTILKNDVVFAIGPAGTGKTYLSVVMAVRALKNKDVERIILVRPAVEAGEKLGFLPGDFMEKINPYLIPLYDGLFDILGVDVTRRYMEKGIIEIAPLAYMRGRTLNSAFIILDEAQNTSPQQMKMFLTRLGFSSKAVITGDVTQVDLPREENSGLIEIQSILKNIPGIAFEYLTREDVVRHPLVQKIIDAYEIYQQAHEVE